MSGITSNVRAIFYRRSQNNYFLRITVLDIFNFVNKIVLIAYISQLFNNFNASQRYGLQNFCQVKLWNGGKKIQSLWGWNTLAVGGLLVFVVDVEFQPNLRNNLHLFNHFVTVFYAKESIFLTTFYGLYFQSLLHINIDRVRLKTCIK